MVRIKPEDKKIKANIENNSTTIIANISTDNNIIKSNISTDNKAIKANVTLDNTATTENKGRIRIATDEEAINGTDNTIAITPHTLRLVTNYVHEQGVASNIWVINHNLNKRPSIMIVDSAGNVVEGAEKYINDNTIEIYFNGAFKGKAYLN